MDKALNLSYCLSLGSFCSKKKKKKKIQVPFFSVSSNKKFFFLMNETKKIYIPRVDSIVDKVSMIYLMVQV